MHREGLRPVASQRTPPQGAVSAAAQGPGGCLPQTPTGSHASQRRGHMQDRPRPCPRGPSLPGPPTAADAIPLEARAPPPEPLAHPDVGLSTHVPGRLPLPACRSPLQLPPSRHPAPASAPTSLDVPGERPQGFPGCPPPMGDGPDPRAPATTDPLQQVALRGPQSRKRTLPCRDPVSPQHPEKGARPGPGRPLGP